MIFLNHLGHVHINLINASDQCSPFSCRSFAWRQGLNKIRINRQYLSLSSSQSHLGIDGPIGTGTTLLSGVHTFVQWEICSRCSCCKSILFCFLDVSFKISSMVSAESLSDLVSGVSSFSSSSLSSLSSDF